MSNFTRRWSIVSLALLSLAALSGESVPTLPPVSAPPPAVVESPQVAIDASTEQAIAALESLLSQKRGSGLTPHEVRTVARTIVMEACRHDLDLSLVLAVIHVESRFDVYAVSPVGAMGLMQIMPSTGIELAAEAGVLWRGPHTLFDPIVNVRLGTAYLRQLADRFGSVSTALAAYNWGPGRIDRFLRRGRAVPSEYIGLVREAQTVAYEPARASRS